MAQTFGHYLAVVEVGNAQLDAVEADLAGWCDRAPLTGSSAHGVEVRAMNKIAAMHAGPVRHGPGRATTRRWRQQGLDTRPQRIGEQTVR